MIITVKLHFDPEDVKAFEARIEAIILKYGEPPQPHLVKERNRALEDAADALGRCAQLIPCVEE